MILQSLVKLYGDLLHQGKIARPGWSPVKVGFAVCLDKDGAIHDLIPLTEETTDEKGKTRVVNQVRTLPAPVKRTVGILPNFLCDNAGYMLGFDTRTEKDLKTGKKDRSKECFSASKDLHLKLLAPLKNEIAIALVRFFENWSPERCNNEPLLLSAKEELRKGSNLIFRVNGSFAHEDPDIIEAWQSYYESDGENAATVQCLVTGKQDELALIHPALKGVNGAQSSGAALVSFNALAFCSYNREQGENAPIGRRAAFAYTAALNYLLADRKNTHHIGDTTVVCWADGAEPQYQEFSASFLFGEKEPDGIDSETLSAAMKRLTNLLPCEELGLSPDKEFYILGLAPNAARLSVRFFYRNSFGLLMRNVNAHYERLRIVGSRFPYLPLWVLLRETANPKSKDKSAASPVLGGAVARAIFTGQRYPAVLMEAIMLRIRADREINPVRAAIIKAYYLKNPDERCPKEVLTLSLNEQSVNIPYTIGRLFAWYEAAQEAANPNINTTIRDRYFNSVAASPAQILPILNNLYQHHLKKMDTGARIYYEKQISDLMGILNENIPKRLSLPEQGVFQLGYYHQKQKRFEKKERA